MAWLDRKSEVSGWYAQSLMLLLLMPIVLMLLVLILLVLVLLVLLFLVLMSKETHGHIKHYGGFILRNLCKIVFYNIIYQGDRTFFITFYTRIRHIFT